MGLAIFSELKADALSRLIEQPRCRVARFLLSLSPESAREFLLLITDAKIEVPLLLRALARRGYAGTRSTLYYHRQYPCLSCLAIKKTLKRRKR